MQTAQKSDMSRRGLSSAALAIMLAMVVGLGFAFAARDTSASAAANPNQINISSATCADGALTLHMLAPHVNEGTAGAATDVTLSYWFGAGAKTSVDEDQFGNGHPDWTFTVTGMTAATLAADFHATAEGSLSYSGNGSDVLSAALANCGGTAVGGEGTPGSGGNVSGVGAGKTFINISSAECVEGELHIHLLAPQGAEAATATTLDYSLNGHAGTQTETADANGHLDWHLVLTDTSGVFTSFTATATANGVTYTYGGHGEDVLKAALADCGTPGGGGATGQITIAKDFAGTTTAVASLTATGGLMVNGSATFTLGDGANHVFSGVAAGSYSFTEAALTGWTLDHITCVSDSGSATGSNFTTTVPTAGITLAAGAHVTCTFYNVASTVGGGGATATVTIAKYIGANHATAANTSSGTFNFTSSWDAANIGSGSGSFSIGTSGFNTPNAYEAVTAAMSVPYSYSLIENGIDGTCTAGDTYRLAGYKVSSVSFADAATKATQATVSLTGQTMNNYIIVVNELCSTGGGGATGQITIAKDFAGTTTAVATLTATGGLMVNGSATFTLGDGANHVFSSVAAGTYSFNEATLTGWTLDHITCVSDSGSATGSSFTTTVPTAGITLAAGAHVTCTFYNVASTGGGGTTGNLTIHKVWQATGGGTAGPDAVFTATGAGTSGFTLTSAASSHTFTGITAGAMTFTEASISGWSLTGASCTGGATTGVGSLVGNVLSLTLAAGENVSCTFTNTQVGTPGTLTIQKVWQPTIGGPIPPANFTATGPSGPLTGFTLFPGTPQLNFIGLAAGAYAFTEAPLPAGWHLATAGCNGGTSSFVGGNTVLLTVATGANVTCTFVNAQTAAGAVSPVVVIPTPAIVLPVPTVLVTGGTPSNANVSGNVPTTTNTNVGSNVPTTTSPSTDVVAGVRAPGPEVAVIKPSVGTAPSPNEAVAGFLAPGVPAAGNSSATDANGQAPYWLAIMGLVAIGAGLMTISASRRRS